MFGLVCCECCWSGVFCSCWRCFWCCCVWGWWFIVCGVFCVLLFVVVVVVCWWWLCCLCGGLVWVGWVCYLDWVYLLVVGVVWVLLMGWFLLLLDCGCCGSILYGCCWVWWCVCWFMGSVWIGWISWDVVVFGGWVFVCSVVVVFCVRWRNLFVRIWWLGWLGFLWSVVSCWLRWLFVGILLLWVNVWFRLDFNILDDVDWWSCYWLVCVWSLLLVLNVCVFGLVVVDWNVGFWVWMRVCWLCCYGNLVVLCYCVFWYLLSVVWCIGWWIGLCVILVFLVCVLLLGLFVVVFWVGWRWLGWCSW